MDDAIQSVRIKNGKPKPIPDNQNYLNTNKKKLY